MVTSFQPTTSASLPSRYLANKCSIASRIDCFLDQSTDAFGAKMKEQVEERLRFYEEGVAPRNNLACMKEVISGLAGGEEEVVLDAAVAEKKKKPKKGGAEAAAEGSEKKKKRSVEAEVPATEEKAKKKKKKASA